MAYETKTKPTKASVRDFIAAVENDTRREDARVLLKLFEKVTGWRAQMWGPTIIGFGRHSYAYESGHSGEMIACGFSPRKANLVLYCNLSDPKEKAELLGKLGKHRKSVACVYINKLADVDMAVLEKIIRAGVANTKKKHAVSAK